MTIGTGLQNAGNTITTTARNAADATANMVRRCVEFLQNADWGRVGRGVATAIIGIGGILLGKGAITGAAAASAVIISVTGGVLAPVAVPLTIGICVWGVATILTGAANVVEGLQDIFFGLGFTIGGRSLDRSLNPIRDTIFRGNATLFNIVNTILMAGSSAFITLAMFGGTASQSRNNNNANQNQNQTETTRVGRWMSMEEYEEMLRTGQVQCSGGNITHVTNPSNPDAFQAYPRGSIFVEFDIPTDSLRQGGNPGWGIIPGPNSIYDRHGINQGLPPIEQMPPATNIRIRIGGGN